MAGEPSSFAQACKQHLHASPSCSLTSQVPTFSLQVIAGNHELSFDQTFTHPLSQKTHRSDHGMFDKIPLLGHKKENLEDAVNTENIRQHLTNCVYLEDSGIELYGLKFWGSELLSINILLEGLLMLRFLINRNSASARILQLGLQLKARPRNSRQMESYSIEHRFAIQPKNIYSSK